MPEISDEITRPIIGIENRTAQEVFDIMCDRLRAEVKAARAGKGVGGREAEPMWRDLALQFDGQRIEALSLLRYVSESMNCAEATSRAHEVKAFLSKAPPSGEEVLAKRIAALASPTGNSEHGGVSEEAVEMARHWIDRYAAGIDEEPQMRRIVAALTAASVQQGKGATDASK